MTDPNRTDDQTSLDTPLMIRALRGETLERPPVWFMRQAGRYLPEYRRLRSRGAGFHRLLSEPPKWRPRRRCSRCAVSASTRAIVFADILLIPRALGQDVWFETGEGPRLGEMPIPGRMAELAPSAGEHLSAVGQTLSIVRAALEPDRALIGFAGAPWTVATYMLDGEHRTIGKGERAQARTYAYADPKRVDETLDVLVEATARYLKMQADAGAQVLKIFESWAEGLPGRPVRKTGPEASPGACQTHAGTGCHRPLDRLPTRLCGACRAVRRRRSRSTRSRSTPPALWRSASACSRSSRSRAPWTRCCCVRAANCWTGASIS